MKRYLLDTNHIGEAIDLLIAEQYVRFYHEVQKAGRALSQVDLILGAMTRQLDAHLLTSDNDFKALADVRTENWRTLVDWIGMK